METKEKEVAYLAEEKVLKFMLRKRKEYRVKKEKI